MSQVDCYALTQNIVIELLLIIYRDKEAKNISTSWIEDCYFNISNILPFSVNSIALSRHEGSGIPFLLTYNINKVQYLGLDI